MIEVRSLGKVFDHDRSFRQLLRGERPGRTSAVEGISFDIDDGEVLGLVGPNGAGKTTLLRMLSTLLTPTTGSARVCGLDVVGDAAAVRTRIGLVASNERSFFWRLTGRQNLRFFADLHHLPSRAAERWIDELLDLLDLRGVEHQRFEAYSTGTKQRFAIARGMLHRPQVLFMDEPTKGVDPKSSADIIAMIRERVVTHARQTVIITTHNLREIEQLCRRTLIMERGRVAYLGTTGDLKRAVNATDVYRVQLARVPPGLTQRLSPLCARPVREPQPGVLELHLQHGGSAMDQVMRLLVESRGIVLDCTRVEIPIEDAFVAFLAGRRQADPVAEAAQPSPAIAC
jgi:ABC-2 type transport system ATP-binding protein